MDDTVVVITQRGSACSGRGDRTPAGVHPLQTNRLAGLRFLADEPDRHPVTIHSVR